MTVTLELLLCHDGSRSDSCVRPGDRIRLHYDPRIAQIPVLAADRTAALRSVAEALDTAEVAGTVTNVRFLRRLADHPGFVSGDLDTGIIDRNLARLTEPEAISDTALALAAVTALGLDAGALSGFSLWSPFRHRLTLADTDVAVTPAPGGATVSVRGQDLPMTRGPEGWRADGAPLSAVRLSGSVAVFGTGGGTFDLADPLDRGHGGSAAGTVEAPMPGKVTAVFVTSGEAVVEGQRLAVLEAMKMEHTLSAPRAGVVAEVLATAGDQIEAGIALVRLEDEE